MTEKRVLITGASAGFGMLTANTLLKEGFKVVASMRNVESKNQEAAEQLIKAGALVTEIDVTDEESVNTGVSLAISELGGLDVVVNNAGVGVHGMQEHFTAEDFKKVFEVNVFGVQRVNRAALPTLRAQESGLLIHVSSLLGRFTLPFYGPYNASKWALEALAENYRVELSGFGLESCIVEPGGFPTTFFGNVIQPEDRSREAGYGDFMEVPKKSGEAFAQALESNPEQNPQLVADAILDLINTPSGERPFRTVVDKMGMGDVINPYNQRAEEVTSQIYGNFHMEGMLNVKVPS